ncbi:hypothetical protein KFE98_21625 [bacterium SCSIO 12741]|nr:hypothetical protein KFE98_21625 [bacterium SCSIO 12741]
MRKLKQLSVLLLASLVWVSCEKGKEGCLDPAAENYDPLASRYGPCEYATDTGTVDPNLIDVKIHIEPLVKGSPFVLETVFQDSLNRNFKSSSFRFYVANVRLIDSDRNKRQVTKTELIDHNTFPPVPAGSPTWDKTIEGRVTKGTYKELYMGFGVDAELNEEYRPLDYPTDHPLNTTYNGMGWSWKDKYRFAVIEGDIDSIGNGGTDRAYYIHTGYSDLYKFNSFDLGTPITFEVGKTYHLYFTQDILRVYSGLDMATEDGRSHTQNAEKKEISIKIQENLAQSLTFSRYTVE